MEFCHLHVHSKYSLNDGMIKAKHLAKKMKEYGMKKCAITNHGVMFNMPEEYQALKNEGLELIIGMETYMAPRVKNLKEPRIDDANYHLVLLCENYEGYKNLIKIASDAALNGFYYKPRTDKRTLREYSKGLICLSACLGGSVATYLSQGRYEDAKKEALEYLDIFGEGNYFLEIQNHGLKEQLEINPLLIKLSKETGIPLVATNDCHYIDKEDAEPHDVLMAIQAKTTIDDTKRKIYSSKEFYFKSSQEMIEIFKDIPEAIENTVKIADRCHVELEFGGNKLPPFKLPSDFNGDNADFLRMLVMENAKNLYTEMTDEVLQRIDYEINTIKNMGYIDYFLITWDFFRFCKDGRYNIDDPIKPDWEPILTGPGRGSGAGSIVTFCLGITKIDPIKYNLLFERFLDSSRITMPDLDNDFQYERRQEVIDYVIYKYGRPNVSQIISFNTMAARAVIRAVGRALNYDYSLYDKTSKMIPQEPGITIEDAFQKNKDFLNLYQTNEKIKKLVDIALKLEGLPTSSSTHAAGVLITNEDGVENEVPMWKNDSGVVCQYDKDWLEPLGLLKMDFLGLRTLGVLAQAKYFVKRNKGIDIDFDEIYKIPTLEPLKIIGEGKTVGIFQLESPGMTSFMKELKPETIDDVIAGISLYRPGPMKEIPSFLNNKRNPESINYALEGTEDIFKETYGKLVYQEQCMRTVIAVAGYDKSDSDGFRRVISKKKKKEVPLHRRWFIEGRQIEDVDYNGNVVRYKNAIPGGLAKGYNKRDLEDFFNLMEDFASYAFNKSHAAAYAVVGYMTAYMVYYYPSEFMAALLNSVQGVKSKLAKYIDYCKRVLNINIIEPDINYSTDKFEPLPNGDIVFSLSVKGTSTAALEGIIKERNENGQYESMLDFLIRTRAFLDKGTFESLIGAGAFKGFDVIKSQWLAALDEFWEDAFKKTKDAEKRALVSKKRKEPFVFKDNLMPRLNGILPDIREFPKEVELRIEKELLGMYLSDNPLIKYAYSIKTISNFSIEDIAYDVSEETGEIMMNNTSVRDRQSVRFIAILNDVLVRPTKKNDLMAICEVEDLSGVAKALVWPRTYNYIKDKLVKDEIYLITGTLMINSDEEPTIIIEDLSPIQDVSTDRAIIHVSNIQDAQSIIKTIKQNKLLQGITPTYLVYNNDINVLLNREFWVNTAYLEKYNIKSEIKTW